MSRESLERTLESGQTLVLEPLPPGAVAQGRDQRQHPGRAGGRARLRRRLAAGAGRPDGRRVPHGRGRRASTSRSPRRPRPRPSPRWPTSSARSPSAPRRPTPRPRTPPACSRRASTPCARRWGRRRPRSSLAAKGAERDQVVYESADLLYHLAVLWRASGVSLDEVARELASRRRADDPPAPGGPAAARARGSTSRPGVDALRGHGRPPRPGAAGAHLHRRLRDAGQRLPQAARRRPGVPAGVGRARAPGALLDDRRAARRR